MSRDRRPTVAVVLSLLAVVLAAGGADAIATGAKKLFKKGSVTSRHIKNGTIRPVDLNPAVATALTGAAGGQLEGPFSNLQLREDAVGARQVIAGGVGTSELADGAVTASKVPDNGLSGADIDESSLAFPSASSQRSAVDGENTITADLGSLGTVALSCLADAQQARVSVLAPPADTTATNIAAELNAQSSGSAVAGARRGPGGDSVVLDTVASPDADHGFSGKVTVARVGETSQHAIVEIAGATRLGGGSTCWLDLQVMR